LALSQASEPQLRPNQPHKNYIKLSTIAAIAFGVSFILIEHGSSVAHNGVLWVTLGAQIGALPITLSNLLKASQISSRKIWVTSILTTLGVMTALNLGADISLAYAFRFGNLGITGVLASLGPVITIMLARFMTTERLSKMQTIGAGLILFGTLMVVHEMH
jgi:drug/metabolite transporter (DMT)-like permease